MDALLDTMKLMFETVPTDDVAEEPIYEATLKGVRVLVTEPVWRSWTGRRYKNGTEYHGPVYVLGKDVLYTGARLCSCKVCQADVQPRFKSN